MTQSMDERYHAALGSRARRQVLDAVVGAAAALDAQAIATQLAVHVTTARFHLEHLEAAGLVRRSVVAEKRRGRPRMVYTAVASADRDENSREQLIGVLAGALATSTDDDAERRAIEAGRLWADALLADRAPSADSHETLIEVLDRLGFDPDPTAESVQLRACPFREAARAHPEIVCSVHRGLVQRIVGAESPAGPARLLPFVQPDLCVVSLS